MVSSPDPRPLSTPRVRGVNLHEGNALDQVSPVPRIRGAIAAIGCFAGVTYGKPLTSDALESLAARSKSKLSDGYRDFLLDVGSVTISFDPAERRQAETVTLGIADPATLDSELLPVERSTAEPQPFFALGARGEVVCVRTDGTQTPEEPQDFEAWIRRRLRARNDAFMNG